VGIGSITSLDSSDNSFWVDYFRIASPARRVVFHPGDVENALVLAGFEVANVITIRDRGPLIGPIKHLPEESIQYILDLFSSDEIRDRYEVEGEGEDLSYLQRWEFVIGRSLKI